jgi:hypothetical protein
MEQKIERRGGKREGAGPPFKYGETTINITLRIPSSKKEEVKRLVYEYLHQFKINRNEQDCQSLEKRILPEH